LYNKSLVDNIVDNREIIETVRIIEKELREGFKK